MKIKRLIITGPTGAVGYAILNECIKRKIEVIAICRVNSKRLNTVPKNPLIKIVECNLDNLLSLKDRINKKCDCFIHLGWDGTYGESRNDLNLQCRNIQYSLNAVNLAFYLGCKVFIGAGSQSEYGHVKGKMRPSTPCFPDNGYGIAKLCASQLTRLECKRLNIRHEWCRIVSLYGPNDGQYTLISSLIKSLKEGKEFKATKGTQIWDYIYSKDAARAFLDIAEKGKNGEIYLIASGKHRTLKEYMLDVKKVVNPNGIIKFGEVPFYKNQITYLDVDVSNLKRDINFKHKYSFIDGIKELNS